MKKYLLILTLLPLTGCDMSSEGIDVNALTYEGVWGGPMIKK